MKKTHSKGIIINFLCRPLLPDPLRYLSLQSQTQLTTLFQSKHNISFSMVDFGHGKLQTYSQQASFSQSMDILCGVEGKLQIACFNIFILIEVFLGRIFLLIVFVLVILSFFIIFHLFFTIFHLFSPYFIIFFCWPFLFFIFQGPVLFNNFSCLKTVC